MAVRRRAGTDTGGGTPTVYRAQCRAVCRQGGQGAVGNAGHACAHTICFLLSLAFTEFVRTSGLVRVGTLTFEEPDTRRFRNLALAYEALHEGGNMPCIVNAANEIVNRAFLEDRIGFLQMSDVIANTMRKTSFVKKPTYEDYLQTDAEARRIAEEYVGAC